MFEWLQFQFGTVLYFAVWLSLKAMGHTWIGMFLGVLSAYLWFVILLRVKGEGWNFNLIRLIRS